MWFYKGEEKKLKGKENDVTNVAVETRGCREWYVKSKRWNYERGKQTS